MKATTKTWIAAALLAGVAATSNAAETEGWYLGAGVGAIQTKVDISGDYGFEENRNSVGYKLYGGYQFNQNWALEMQYADLGMYRLKNKNVSLELKTQVVSLSGVGIIPLSDSFSLLGKIGVAGQYGKVTASNGISGNGSNTAVLLGAGAEYSVTKNVALRAEYEYIGSSELKNNLLTVGMRYTF